MELRRYKLLWITEENLKPLIAIHELNYLKQIDRLTVTIIEALTLDIRQMAMQTSLKIALTKSNILTHFTHFLSVFPSKYWDGILQGTSWPLFLTPSVFNPA
jgi:hypothetical protein